ncbi:MAG TPA: hypothetical protein VEA38_06240, partial [Terriglobales bacterium]|nr:hypothetical protein [Terriglobales bacterium]
MARKTAHAAAARKIVAECRRRKIELVRFMFVDSGGIIRAKACHTRFLESYLTSGIGLTLAAQSMNALDQLL